MVGKLLTETRQKLFSERDRVLAMNQEIASLRVANDEVLVVVETAAEVVERDESVVGAARG